MTITEQEQPICILMATYNGGKFLNAQLDSLIAQSYTNWKLFIRDDNSSDKTVSIVNEYSAKDNRVFLHEDNLGNLGSCQNFATLLRAFTGKFQYFMFCDQDDFWLPNKIQSTLVEMKQCERLYEKETPVLVYTNFKYVDLNLQVIDSVKNYEATKVSNLCFSHLLAQNPAYGCTMMLNKKLQEIAKVIPIEAENHDYWIALLASTFGKIIYIKKPTILYRQHNNNISTNYDNSSLKKRFKRIVFKGEIFKDVDAKLKMAVAFKIVYFSMLSEKNKRVLSDFIALGKKRSFLFLIKNLSNGVRRQTMSQTVLFYIGMLYRRTEAL